MASLAGLRFRALGGGPLSLAGGCPSRWPGQAGKTWLLILLGTAFFLASPATRADLFVPASYPTIQAAIDAAPPGEVIQLAPGRYGETLTINKSLTITGSGTNDCVVYSLTNIPIISITGPATVVLSNFEVEGGQYQPLGYYSGFSDLGIAATNASLVLHTLTLNQIKNYFVTVVNGSLGATNVSLWTRNVLGACDVGFQLKGCTAIIAGLQQDAGHLDHTININNPPATPADVTILNSRIRTSIGSYGNCIRTYVNSTVRITNCFLYRGPGETIPATTAFNHSAISVNGYSNTVFVSGNTVTNVPWAIYCFGSAGGNRVLVESNYFMNCPIGGLVWDAMSYAGIDLGGGPLGSSGGNVFAQFPAPLTNYYADILFTNYNGASSANIFALRNTWSNPTNRTSVVLDKLRNPIHGRLISDDLQLRPPSFDPFGRSVVSWNERGAGEHYTLEVRTNLNTDSWAPAPGPWPRSNPGLADLSWTNSTTVATPLFYRLRSVVP